MSKQDDFLKKLYEENYVDENKMAVIASAKTLPSGEFGMCILCINKENLFIFDTDFKQNIGELLYTIDLRQITDFKSSAFIFNPYIKFNYKCARFNLTNFGNAKNFITTLTSHF